MIHHLLETQGIPLEEAEQLVREVVNYFRESPDEFVRRRHHELQNTGMKNAAIFEQLATEIAARRFPAGPYSVRQIRRMIYG